MKPDTPLYGPVCGFGGRVGERHQQDGLPAPLGACDPVVNEQGESDEPKKGDTQPLPLKGEG